MSPRTVLHVLPHPGGGGETYVDSLEHMAGYSHTRFFLATRRNPLAAAPLLALNVPRVNLLARRFDIIHVHGEAAGFFCLPALERRPSVVTLHGLNLLRRRSPLVWPIAKLNLRQVLRSADRTICVSEAELGEVIQTIGNGSANRLVVVPNGVGPTVPENTNERSFARTELGVDDRIVLLWVGALDPPKDPLTAARATISAAASGSEVVLLLAGDGGLREEVEDVATGSTDAVRVLGHRGDVGRLLSAADVFVLSSSHEGLPYALLEAMAAGLPSIVSDYPGASETIGDAGLMAPQASINGFAEAIGRLAADASLRAELGARARRRVESRYSLEHMLAGTQSVYEDVIGGRGEGG